MINYTEYIEAWVVLDYHTIHVIHLIKIINNFNLEDFGIFKVLEN